ncbi:unnamed protein product [Durusdinium trenchii]|uniref:HEAT repeat-containing protein 1 n=2 Tax=Durusdinium trenchii TaxID=1381693 RepID=A0ABP0P8J9_9DINO
MRSMQALRFLPPSSQEYLASVLSELGPEELQDYETVRMLLEPFLLDALKSGRQTPNDRTSGEKVGHLCRQVFEELKDMSGSDRRSGCAAALRHAAQQLSAALQLPTETVESLSSVLGQLTPEELAAGGTELLLQLLTPPLQEAFHDCGEWPAEEDEAKIQQFAAVLLRELQSKS